MPVDYELLIHTLKNETMDEETTYTRGQAYKLAQQWRNEQQKTILKEADEQMQAARDTFFQAIADYKEVYNEINTEINGLTNAINGCFYKYDDFYGPVNVGTLPASIALMKVNGNQVHNYKLYLKDVD